MTTTSRRSDHRPPRRRRHRRRGAIWVLVLAMIVVLLGMTALSVDVAYMNLTRTQLRSATDAAARAGGEALSRLQSTSDARAAAKAIAAKNTVAGEPLLLSDSDIVFGTSAPQSNGVWKFTAGGSPTNAMQIAGRRTSDSLGGSVGLFFGRIFNVNNFQPALTSTVVKMDRDICLVLDRSSSMKLDLGTTAETISQSDPRFLLPPHATNSRWAACADAVSEFVATLQTTPQQEKVAVCSFASDWNLLGVLNKESNRDRSLTFDISQANSVANYYSGLKFNGMTATASGIDEGTDALMDPVNSRPFARKVMVFLTDGFRTAGGDPIAAARQAAAKNIVIYTITFGATFDHSEMIAVASATGGQHYHAPDADSLKQIFHDIAASTNVILTE